MTSHHGGMESKRRHDLRKALVQKGRASWWTPYRPIAQLLEALTL